MPAASVAPMAERVALVAIAVLVAALLVWGAAGSVPLPFAAGFAGLLVGAVVAALLAGRRRMPRRCTHGVLMRRPCTACEGASHV